MSENIELKIKELERQLAVKQAYLSIQLSFPKGSKLPQDVKDQVINELRKACTQLADDNSLPETGPALSAPMGSGLTTEEIGILKSVAATIKSKTSNQPAPIAPPEGKTEKSQDTGFKKAILITLESLPMQYRNKVASQSEVYVKSIRGDLATIILSNGVVCSVPEEDLEYK